MRSRKRYVGMLLIVLLFWAAAQLINTVTRGHGGPTSGKPEFMCPNVGNVLCTNLGKIAHPRYGPPDVRTIAIGTIEGVAWVDPDVEFESSEYSPGEGVIHYSEVSLGAFYYLVKSGNDASLMSVDEIDVRD